MGCSIYPITDAIDACSPGTAWNFRKIAYKHNAPFAG
jgi:hypothetical protein